MILLDTHALLWLDSGAPMTRESTAAIDDAAARGEVLISPVSAWEIGLLVRKGRIRLDLEPLPYLRARTRSARGPSDTARRRRSNLVLISGRAFPRRPR